MILGTFLCATKRQGGFERLHILCAMISAHCDYINNEEK